MAELVSIVIVAHNNWPDLEMAIQSALRQSHQPVEVLVVDNGSTDATPEEVPKRFGPQVKYLRQANRLEGGGRNTGMYAATGDFLQFLDGDDFLAPNKLEKQLAVLQAEPEVEAVYGDYRHFQGGEGWAHWRDRNAREHADLLAQLVAPVGNAAGLFPASVLFRRSLLERLGPWEEANYCDQDYWLRAAWGGARFRYCPGAYCFYQQRPGQITAHASAMHRSLEHTWEKAQGYITAEPYRTQLRKGLAWYRYLTALQEPSFTRAEAWGMLARARATDTEVISLAAYAAGRLLILLPGARALTRQKWLLGLGRILRRALGVRR